MPPNQPLQRMRAAPRDRCYFTASLRAEPCFDLDGAPLNGRPLGRNPTLVDTQISANERGWFQ
jgi:hypothetical protein